MERGRNQMLKGAFGCGSGFPSDYRGRRFGQFGDQMIACMVRFRSAWIKDLVGKPCVQRLLYQTKLSCEQSSAMFQSRGMARMIILEILQRPAGDFSNQIWTEDLSNHFAHRERQAFVGAFNCFCIAPKHLEELGDGRMDVLEFCNTHGSFWP